MPLLIRTVPVAFGNVIVLSAVGSVTVKVVSLALSVAPSKTITASSPKVNVGVPELDVKKLKFVLLSLLIISIMKIIL